MGTCLLAYSLATSLLPANGVRIIKKRDGDEGRCSISRYRRKGGIEGRWVLE